MPQTFLAILKRVSEVIICEGYNSKHFHNTANCVKIMKLGLAILHEILIPQF